MERDRPREVVYHSHPRSMSRTLASDASTLPINSTISRDRTEGKKANQDESLRALSKGKGKAEQAEFVYFNPTSATSPSFFTPFALSSGPYEVEGQTEYTEPPSQSIKPIPWRVDTLHAQFEERKSMKLERTLEGDQNMSPAEREASILLADTEGVIHIGPPLNELPEAAVDSHPKARITSKRETLHGTPDLEDTPYECPDLATTLARDAKLRLGFSLYGDTPLSNFVSMLLDTINKKDAHIAFLDSRTKHLEQMLKDTPLSVQRHSPSSKADKLTRTGIFLDAPSRRGVELNGSHGVWDLTNYLFENTDIIFVVFKEYNCDGTPGSRLRLGGSRKTRFDDVGSHRILPDDEYIYVVSDALRAALIDIADCSPFDNLTQGEMTAPYPFIYHHRAQLRELAERQGELALHTSSLFLYVESHYGADYDDADAKFAKRVVTPEHLTKLWVPNQILVTHEGSHDVAYVLGEWPNYRNFKRGKQKDLQLRCWSWQYDGTVLKRDFESQTVNLANHNEIAIEKLSIYPLRFASEDLRERLRIRGQKFWGFRQQYLITYSGLDFNKETTYDHNRFMIDTQTYLKMHKTGAFQEATGVNNADSFDSWPTTIHRDEPLSDANLTILPPNIYGFDFQEKEWINLSIDQIGEVTWNKGAYNRLVLPSKTKELIQALVTTQISGKMQDIIANKGNGLVVLLHGGPGTGKTLTAETVAEMAEKPLYRVTCGDIGTNAVEVEKYLTSIFYLGKIWGCVLLLDEADVFLEERILADLQRNSFVSVFLHMLEYYDGILILTSNRVGTFDAAFKSRIQVSLHYSNLSRASRKKIWQNFLDMLEGLDDEVDVSELERHLDDLAQDEMNGRQIRNCVTTARQLAAFRKQKLGWQHLEQAIRTAGEFNRYLKEVHGGLTEDQMARGDNLR
ncbi:hypothetical protein FGG08_007238 [Glutinoglossum americanum]|uniref:AAA+ ATPase domain-containing protein n=1 Tax=Glutinoglossum americanum TaxID=1670608 RepID=A0A9P8HUE3_9PEZI|nr:hypothetical protein FGG08_007238 [Glutinoglossum americanum]